MTDNLVDTVNCLLVDDLPENLLSLEALLRRPGLVILKARSGHEALELLLEHDIALALLDVQMPGMDGFELAELMRGTERTQRVPIIFLTAGSADYGRRFRGYEAGAVDFLHKPIEPDILRSKAEVFFALARQQLKLARQRDELKASAETNARLLTESRQYAAALKEADKRKDEFLANMSHEIRTPMNAIIGLANILARDTSLTSLQQQCVATLQTSGQSLLSLINDLLDISKIESSVVEFERVPFSPVQVAEEAINILSQRAQEKGLRLHLEESLSTSGRKYYLGDPTRLRQILLNLCSNAIKFTDAGHVTINIHDTATSERKGEMQFEVRDTGIGIPEEKLGSIFEKFVQADSSINRRYGGTGLGLAITKNLVEMMGGLIRVESSPKGSCFTLSLPLEISEANTRMIDAPISRPSRGNDGNSLILLVEDHPPNVLVARLFLENFGYTIDVAGTGQQAYDLSGKQDYLAVLMDVQMPEMDGFEATSLIRQREVEEGRPRTHIIGMTAHALIGDRDRCIAVGMDDYITKPFDPEELQSMLQKLWVQERAAS